MKTFIHYADTNPAGCERMHVGNSTEIKEAEVSGKFRIVEFKELDNNEYICLLPSLSIVVKAETKDKSILLLKKSIDKYCHYLAKLPAVKMHSELTALGWENNEVFKKNYSHFYISEFVAIQTFNVKQDDVITEMLEVIS